MGTLSYLGTKIGESLYSVKYRDPIISRVASRLSQWETEHLSIAGWLVILKSSIDSLPIFWFSLYKIPVTILNKLEQVMRGFQGGHSDRSNKRIHLLN